MIRLIVIAFVVFPMLWHQPSLGQTASQVVEHVDRIFVIRRTLTGDAAIKRGDLAHSALLLRTKDENWYVLEFMRDSNVYLTRTEQQVVQEHTKESWAEVKLKGRYFRSLVGEDPPIEKQLVWTRQLKGESIEAKFTPQQLKEQMEAVVKKYSLLKGEHCHKAQEHLRKSLGLKVD
jgi:hypothetical protein